MPLSAAQCYFLDSLKSDRDLRIVKSHINADGTLVLTVTDGTIQNVVHINRQGDENMTDTTVDPCEELLARFRSVERQSPDSCRTVEARAALMVSLSHDVQADLLAGRPMVSNLNPTQQ